MIHLLTICVLWQPSDDGGSVPDATVEAVSIPEIPEVDNIIQGLKDYVSRITKKATTNLTLATNRQHRSSCEELGITAMDTMDEIGSLQVRLQFLKSLVEEVKYRRGVQGALRVDEKKWGTSVGCISEAHHFGRKDNPTPCSWQ